MSRLHLLTNYDDMTMNKKEEGYVRVQSYVCGDGCVFWKDRHIVIRARNPFTLSWIGNDDQSVTMASRPPFSSSFDARLCSQFKSRRKVK
jgi:hypothetical protein